MQLGPGDFVLEGAVEEAHRYQPGKHKLVWCRVELCRAGCCRTCAKQPSYLCEKHNGGGRQGVQLNCAAPLAALPPTAAACPLCPCSGRWPLLDRVGEEALRWRSVPCPGPLAAATPRHNIRLPTGCPLRPSTAPEKTTFIEQLLGDSTLPPGSHDCWPGGSLSSSSSSSPQQQQHCPHCCAPAAGQQAPRPGASSH